MKKANLPSSFHKTPTPAKLNSFDPRETDPKSSDTSPEEVDHREVESPMIARKLDKDTDRKEESGEY